MRFISLFEAVYKHSADGTVWFDPSDSELSQAYRATHGELRGTMIYNVIKDIWAFTDEDVVHGSLARKCSWSGEDCFHFYIYPKEKLISFSLNAYSLARGGNRYFDPTSVEGKKFLENKYWCWKLTRGWSARGLGEGINGDTWVDIGGKSSVSVEQKRIAELERLLHVADPSQKPFIRKGIALIRKGIALRSVEI